MGIKITFFVLLSQLFNAVQPGSHGQYFKCLNDCLRSEELNLNRDGRFSIVLNAERYKSKETFLGKWYSENDTLTLSYESAQPVIYLEKKDNGMFFLISEKENWDSIKYSIDSISNQDELIKGAMSITYPDQLKKDNNIRRIKSRVFSNFFLLR